MSVNPFSYFKPTAVISSIGAGIGGAVGFVVGGPAMIVDGVKIGLGLGVQVACVQKTDQGIDAMGRKIDQITDRALSKMEESNLKMVNTIHEVARIWSIIMLAGYAMRIAFDGVDRSGISYNLMACKYFYENLHCLSLSMTTLSLNGAISAIAIHLGLKFRTLLSEAKK